jgi:methyl-accepting chemotaxis protein
MSETIDIRERLAFIGIDDETRSALSEVLPIIKSHLPSILGEFYDMIRQWPDQARMFPQGGMDRAKNMQESHWVRLFSGHFDDDYVKSVRRIGLTHSRIGLEPRWFIGGYAFVQSRLSHIVSTMYANRWNPATAQKQTARMMRAVMQAIMLDTDLAITVYLEQNKLTYDRKLAALANDLEGTIAGIVQTIETAADGLNGAARAMTSTAEQSERQSVTVAAAAEQASANVNAVAGATEELSASIQEISRQVSNSTEITNRAIEEAQQTNTMMRELSQVAQQIGDVVGLINTIASQTNLLALNATIEAARAGEAGKGFAVVASEVKALAQQTAKATEEIGSKAQAIQHATSTAESSIGAITATISRMGEIASTIAAAIEEQGAATREIAENVGQAAKGTAQVSSNISMVTHAAAETGVAAAGVLDAAQGLNRETTTLKSSVSDFLMTLRAA